MSETLVARARKRAENNKVFHAERKLFSELADRVAALEAAVYEHKTAADAFEACWKEAKDALEADGWQTIDTAPKDRRILLGRFSGDKKDEYDTYCAVDRWKHPTAGYSYTGWGQFNATHWPPTHWREIGRPA